MSSPVPPGPSPLYAAYLKQKAAGRAPTPLYAAYLASKAQPSEFADVQAGATTTAPQPANAPAVAGAMFGTADLQDAARDFGLPQGEPGAVDMRAVQGAIRRANVAAGVEEPRLSERLVKAAGLDPGTAAAVTGLENAVRGLPSGAVQGIVGGTADAVKAGGILLDPFRALGELAAGERPSALRASDLLREQVEAPVVNAIRDVTRPEGMGGMIGEQAGALATQAGAAKALEALSALRATREAAKAAGASQVLTDETMDRVGGASADVQAADRLARTRAAFDARQAADKAAAERMAAVEARRLTHPTTVGPEQPSVHTGRPIITPPPVQPRGLLAAGPPVVPEVPAAAEDAFAGVPDRAPPPQRASLTEARPVPTIRRVEVKGREVWLGGNEKYRFQDDADLYARRQDLLDRLDASQRQVGEGVTPFARDVRYGVVSGTSVNASAGRAIAALNRDTRLLTEVETELAGRGHGPDDIDFYAGRIRQQRALAAAAERGGMMDAASLDAVAAEPVERPLLRVRANARPIANDATGALLRPGDVFDVEHAEGRWHVTDAEGRVVRQFRGRAELQTFLDRVQAPQRTVTPSLAPPDEAALERLALQTEEAPAGAMRFLADEFGGASIRAATTLAGGASGAATGYATGDDNNRVGRAITFGLAGAIAGSVLGEAAAKAGTFRRTQLAASDPDVAAVLSEGSPRPSARAAVTGLGAKLAAGARSGFQKVLDDVYAARKFGTDVGKTTAVSEEASRAKGWRGFSDALIGVRAGGAPPTTPTLRLAVEAAKGHEADVTALLRAERAIELDDAGKGWYLATDRATTQRVIQKLGAVPEVRQAADQLRAFYDHLLELRWKNGLLSDAEYQAIRAAHQQYVPFVPATEAEALGAGGSRGGRLFNSTKGVRKLTEGAGGYAKVDPFEQAALDAQRTARDVSRQRVMQQVAGIVEQTPEAAAPFIRRLPSEGLQSATRQAEGRTIDAIVNGKRERYEVLDPDLYDALSQVGPTSQSVVTRLFGPVANALRAGVTSIPSFGLANASRDAFFTTQAFPFPVKSALAGSAAGAVTGAATDPEHPLAGAAKGAALGLGAGIMARHAYRIGTGLSEVLGNTTLYQDWLREGGAGFGWFGASRKDAARLVTQLRHGTRVRDLVNPRTWWDAVQYLNEAIEQAPRVAKYRTDLEAGLSPRAAAVGSREVSVDFAKGGGDPLVKAARGSTAFWNANLQGKLKLGAVFRNPKAWAVGLAGMTAPSVALWAINKDDPEYWRRPQWERNLFWLVPAGEENDGRTRFLKIPKPFEVGFAFGSIPERLLDFAYQRDPDRTKAAVEDMLGQTAGGLAPVPTAILPVAETQLGKEGYDTFRQRPIVTSDVQNLPTREQYNLDTPGPAIGVARGIEAVTGGLVSPSPQKVAHVLEGYGGTLGQRALELGDKAGKELGLDTRPQGSRMSPSQWARFVTRPNDFGTDDVQAMYRQFDMGQRHYQQVKDLLDEGRTADAQEYLAAHLSELQAYYRLKQPVADFRKLSAMRRATEQDRSLTPDQRRLKLDAIGQVAAQVAADAFARPADERMAAR